MRYRKSFQVVLPSGEKATVFLGAVQPDRQNGGVRISLNPAKLKPGDIDFFHAVMKKILGSLYLRQLETPVINRIDVAVDLIGAQLDKLLFAYTNAQKLTIFAKQLDTRSQIESITLAASAAITGPWSMTRKLKCFINLFRASSPKG